MTWRQTGTNFTLATLSLTRGQQRQVPKYTDSRRHWCRCSLHTPESFGLLLHSMIYWSLTMAVILNCLYRQNGRAPGEGNLLPILHPSTSTVPQEATFTPTDLSATNLTYKSARHVDGLKFRHSGLDAKLCNGWTGRHWLTEISTPMKCRNREWSECIAVGSIRLYVCLSVALFECLCRYPMFFPANLVITYIWLIEHTWRDRYVITSLQSSNCVITRNDSVLWRRLTIQQPTRTTRTAHLSPPR